LADIAKEDFYMINQKEITQRIREERRMRGISQYKLGAKLGVDNTYISKLESNKKNVSLNMLADIATALNVSTDYLIFGAESQRNVFSAILEGCNDKEKRIIYENINALKRILVRNRS